MALEHSGTALSPRGRGPHARVSCLFRANPVRRVEQSKLGGQDIQAGSLEAP